MKQDNNGFKEKYLHKYLGCSVKSIVCNLSSSVDFHEFHITHPKLRVIGTGNQASLIKFNSLHSMNKGGYDNNKERQEAKAT